MHKSLLLPCLFVSQTLIAGESLWTDISSSYQSRSNKLITNASHTSTTRKLSLDYEKLAFQLSQPSDNLVELPLPNGEFMMVRAKPNNVMSHKLAEKFPEIQTWEISDPYNPSVTGSIDIGPNGFHGFVYTTTGEQIFIDPNDNSDNTLYTVLSNRGKTNDTGSPFSCKVHDHTALSLKPAFSPTETTERSIGTTADPFITYRLAIAATGEYTELYGGTKANAMAGINTTISRINQIYQRDLSISLEIVDNNNNIIYTSPSSDPYTNQDAVAMVDENIVNINSIIGNNNYDIGHVFGTGNTGGLAFINSVCGTYKAGGVTGSNLPQGDVFNVDYVAHEIGHQLGASHTFNGYQSNCSGGNRASDTAVEPGSGSSIMAYAGICGSDNLQSNSDAFFHSVSINEIKKFTREDNGASCGSIAQTSNRNPTVDAGNNFTIPAGTPFYLVGDTSDLDGDTVSHSWEQVDTGNVGGLYTDLGNNPLFRTWPPTETATRYLPMLSSLIDNQATVGEVLPTTTRSLNFRLLARDNNGGINQDDMYVSVVNTGESFAITSQTTDHVLSAGQTTLVTWNVASTNESPINCAAVDINIIHSSGNNVSLLTNTANDGSQAVTIPSDAFSLENVNLQVACSDNIFFAVSEGKLTILGGQPILTANNPTINEGDNGVQNITFVLSLSVSATENLPVDYTITDQSTSLVIQRGQAVIIKGNSTATVHTSIVGDTITENDQTLVLTLTKPTNAQFTTGESILTSVGTILDDDISIAATPVSVSNNQSSTSSATSGGGSIHLLSVLGLLLLVITRNTYKRRFS